MRVLHLRGTTSLWQELGKDIVPLSGELVVEIDEKNRLHKLKIGDGNSTYEQLSYLLTGDEIISLMSPIITEAVSSRIPKKAADPSAPFISVVAINNGVYDENLMPTDDSYTSVRSIGSAEFGKDVDNNSHFANSIPRRDSKGNLFTGTPVDNEDCANKKYVDDKIPDNIKNSTGSSSLQQVQDTGYTGIAIKTKNPNAYALDNTLTDNEPIGATGAFASSFGGVTSAQGERSFAEGTNTIAKGKYSHAEGDNSVALGNDSHAEGLNCVSFGSGSHSEGGSTQAIGMHAHSEGVNTIASGTNSHAEGNGTTASGVNSHAEGNNTTASSVNQHVQGIFNIEDKNNTYADIIGNGENPSSLSNAATVDWKGNAWYAGDVYVGSTSGTNKDEGSKKLATEDYVNSAISSSGGSGIVVDTALSSTSVNPVQNKVINTALSKKVDTVSGKGLSTNDYTTAEKNKLSGIEAGANKTVVDSELSSTSTNPVQNKVINTALSNKMDKTNPTGTGSFSLNRKPDTTTGDYSFAEGFNTTAEGIASHAEGANTIASGMRSHAEGWQTLTGHRGFKVTACKKLTATTGTYTLTSVTGLEVNQRYSVQLSTPKENCGKITAIDTAHKKITVDGYPNISLRPNGSSTANSLTIVDRPTLGDIVVSGNSAHAEGAHTTASGDYSHAEGSGTKASGDYSHAEGGYTKASGDYSHAEGYNTTALGNPQHVQGKYNIEDTVNTYADIIGNGFVDNEGEIQRSNAATVDWVGYAWYKGAVTSNAADYAEFFEWLDGNPNNEDRVGYLVTLDGEKIRFANPEDEILGIISANPAILGDNYECDWNGKYLTDEFGRILYDKVEEFIDIPKVDEETGETIVEKKSLGFFDHPRINPDYDPDQEYINRRNRSEWAMVGMLGKLFVRDDGTAQVNGYVSTGENGIATASVEKTNMRVLSRVNDHIVKVLLK